MNNLAFLSALAAMVNEAECDIINAAPNRVQLLLDVLQHDLDRRSSGWSCTECAYTVRMLAQNDANKQLLVKLGVLELLVKMGRTGNEEEQYACRKKALANSVDPDETPHDALFA
ncbi:hypothetical protein DPMN_069445 [Dreissena polymorpha]|uniref:Uncharacterized protein n=1 Tax=Dreissena polymorpha TaxID=45954 RepID=A0A9D3Z4D2_DREPO|nr:hypothetical protein DPMN_069445 [Dreissena polymorpha]